MNRTGSGHMKTCSIPYQGATFTKNGTLTSKTKSNQKVLASLRRMSLTNTVAFTYLLP